MASSAGSWNYEYLAARVSSVFHWLASETKRELRHLPPGHCEHNAGGLAGHKEVKKETLKDLYRQALRLSPLDNEAHVANIQEMLMALAALIA